MSDIQSLYQKTIKFAAHKHLENNQKLPGTELPYLVHLCNVAMEIFMTASHTEDFNLAFALQLALLHDSIEDTSTTFEEIQKQFGPAVSEGVLALTKNKSLPKDQQVADSLSRIKKLPKEVAATKLADRITNLQAPPAHWSREKRLNYQVEASLIWGELKDSNQYLGQRLHEKIEEYSEYIEL